MPDSGSPHNVPAPVVVLVLHPHAGLALLPAAHTPASPPPCAGHERLHDFLDFLGREAPQGPPIVDPLRFITRHAQDFLAGGAGRGRWPSPPPPPPPPP